MKLLAFLSFTDAVPLSLFGPLFFLYMKRTVKHQGPSWEDSIHLLPILVTLIQYYPFYILSTDEKIKLLVTRNVYDFLNVLPHYSLILSLLLLVYGGIVYLKFQKIYSQDLELSIWLRSITLVYFLFSFSFVSYYILSKFSLLSIEHDYFIAFAMVAFIGLTSYFSFMHPTIFNGKPLKQVIPFIKYEKTGLSPEFSMEMKEKLALLMEKEKPYLNPEIRLDSLAELLDVSRHHASQIINEHYSMNFFEFINYYRIKEAVGLLMNKKSEFTITDIAYHSGFNNRISFYKAFKKIVGTTPSEYKEEISS